MYICILVDTMGVCIYLVDTKGVCMCLVDTMGCMYVFGGYYGAYVCIWWILRVHVCVANVDLTRNIISYYKLLTNTDF